MGLGEDASGVGRIDSDGPIKESFRDDPIKIVLLFYLC